MYTRKLAFIPLFLVCAAASAATLNVPATYATISAAVTAASPGDTIMVAPGTYTGAGNFNIAVNQNLTIQSSGGAAATIIDLTGASAGNQKRAFNIAGNGINVTITGFTIKNGFFDNGGAISVSFAGNVTISQCVFTGNSATTTGGAIYYAGSTGLSVLQSLFQNNSAGDTTSNSGAGGAIEVNGSVSSILISNDAFIGNTASYDGGAIDILGIAQTSPNVTIINSSFASNNANGFVASSPLSFIRSLRAPDSTHKPGAIDSFLAQIFIKNSILYGDSTSVEYSTLNSPGSGNFGGSLEIDNSDVRGGFTGTGAIGSGNIDADPLYLDPASDLRLRPLSPAINPATSSNTLTKDINGATRDNSPDMGAYEYVLTLSPVAFIATAGNVFSGQVATLQDSNGGSVPLAYFAATINWGDGSGATTASLAAGTPNPVSGTHTYNSQVQYNVTLTVNMQGVNSTPVTSTATYSVTIGSGIVTHLGVSAPTTVTAGIPFNVTVTALTASNTTASSLITQVALTKSDNGAGSAVAGAYTLTAGDAGLHTFTNGVTLVTAGVRTVGAYLPVANDSTGSANVTVTGGAANRLTLSTTANPTAGNAYSITVTAFDQYGNVATGYQGTVHFTKSDSAAGAVVPANYTFQAGDNGVHVFSAAVTWATAGPETLTVTDTVTSSITATASVSVSGGTTTHFGLVTTGTITAGASFQLTVTALDQFNNAGSYNGNVAFSSSDTGSGVSLPDPSPYSTLIRSPLVAAITLVKAGSKTITASDGTITSTITVTVTPAATITFLIPFDNEVNAGDTRLSFVKAYDSFGNLTPAYTGIVHFTSTDPAAVLQADSTLTNGVGDFHFTIKTAPGPFTITGTDTLNSSITGTTPPILVLAKPATHLRLSATTPQTSSTPFAVTVTALDPYENPDGFFYRGNVHFTSTDGASGTSLPADYKFPPGVNATHTFSGITLASAGTQTITVTDLGNTSITGTIDIVVNAIVPVITNLNPPAVLVNSGAFTLTITASNVASNATVTFNGNVVSAVNNNDGTLTATIPANLLTTAKANVPVIITNPAPALAASSAATFSVATQCSYALGATSASAVSGVSTGTVSVITPATCSWNASSNSSFLTVTSSLPGSGVGTLTYSVTANTSFQRIGTITIAGQTFTVTQNTAVTELDAVATTGSPGAVAAIPILLSSSLTAQSPHFTLSIIPNASAPAVGPLAFQAASGQPSPATGVFGPSGLSFDYGSALFSGTVHLGDILVTIPSSAVQGQTYAVSFTVFGFIAIPSTLTVASVYPVSDIFPFTGSNAGAFGDAVSAPNPVNSVDLLETLRIVTGIEALDKCSDRWDATDSFPVDTPTQRGGGDGLNTLDILETLRRATGIDSSRPTRSSRGLAPCPTAPPPPPQSLRRHPAEAALEFGEAHSDADGHWRTPIYVRAITEASWVGLALSIESPLDDDEPQIKYVADGGLEASLSDNSLRGKLALAWLNDWTARAGDKVLLGYVETASEPTALKFINASANAKTDGRTIPLDMPRKLSYSPMTGRQSGDAATAQFQVRQTGIPAGSRPD